jgi:hypothetical protein
MTTKQQRPAEEIRRRLQRDRDTLADTVQVTLGPPEDDIAQDKGFLALSVPKGGRAVRKATVPARQYWPSANSQRAPSRPLGTKKAPR